MACVNERLRSALARTGVSTAELATACGVDPKTVDRWINTGRRPHARHRFTAAQCLGIDEVELWPIERRDESSRPSADSELASIYANRASVPRQLWLDLLEGAAKHIDVLVFSGTFYAQTNPHVARMLIARAHAGTSVRLCFGDPAGESVAIRGREEGIGDTLAAKIRASLTYYRELVSIPGCEVRLHDTTLYASLFRYDDELLVNPHIFGQPASANPLLHLRRRDNGEWFELYAASFDTVWNGARPWAPGEEGHRRGQD